MQHELVIARGFRGKPLKRAVIKSGRGVIYLSAPERIEAVRSGLSLPIGFPPEDVLAFEETFSALERSWADQRGDAVQLWSRLKR